MHRKCSSSHVTVQDLTHQCTVGERDPVNQQLILSFQPSAFSILDKPDVAAEMQFPLGPLQCCMLLGKRKVQTLELQAFWSPKLHCSIAKTKTVTSTRTLHSFVARFYF